MFSIFTIPGPFETEPIVLTMFWWVTYLWKHNLAKLTIALSAVIDFGIVSPSESSAEAEVCEFDVAFTINQDVVGFDVPVDEQPQWHKLSLRCKT